MMLLTSNFSSSLHPLHNNDDQGWMCNISLFLHMQFYDLVGETPFDTVTSDRQQQQSSGKTL